MENLQSQLKLREGEIAQLQVPVQTNCRASVADNSQFVVFKSIFWNIFQLEISNLERTRAVMAEELVRLTNQNDDMEEKVKEIPKLRIQLKVSSAGRNGFIDAAFSAGVDTLMCISGAGAEAQHHPADVW